MTPSKPLVEAVREELAALCHEQWSGWMEYLFDKCVFVKYEGGTRIIAEIPHWAVERWQRQAKASYAELSEDEKESDRKEADKFLAFLKRQDLQSRVEQLEESARYIGACNGMALPMGVTTECVMACVGYLQQTAADLRKQLEGMR